MQDARAFFFLQLAFHHLARHLHAHAEHGLGDFNMLSLQESLGVFREVQGHERAFILGAAQFNSAVGQLDNFKKGRWHKGGFST